MGVRRVKPVVTAAIAVALVAAGAVTAHAAIAPSTRSAGDNEQVSIAQFLQQAMDGQRFQEVLDLAPPASVSGRALFARGEAMAADKEAQKPQELTRRFAANTAAAAPQPITLQPQLDATVLELDDQGRVVSSGNVLMSPQYPHGVPVPVDGNLHTTAVRYRQWDDRTWYDNRGQGVVDVVPGRENAELDFMSPYPASVLKLMVAFGVLRLVDSGAIGLDDTYAYKPTAESSLCNGPTTDTVRGYLDKSLTRSSNEATCSLIKLLSDRNAVDGLNRTFQDLGLETLRLPDTNPATGGHWTMQITMSSLDTAKLLLLFNGAPGTLWTAPNGQPVTNSALKDASRELVKSKLAEQVWNWNLSTTNYCNRGYPAAGIPQRTADRWIGPDGTVSFDNTWVGLDGKVHTDTNRFGRDVRPCNESAEVTFLHKPGWVDTAGNDAGIVRSLPGKAARHYIISVFSSLGNQYQDAQRPADPAGVVAVWYTQKLAQLGLAVDQFMAKRSTAAKTG